MRTGSRQDLGGDTCVQGDAHARVLKGDYEAACSCHSLV